MVIGGRTATSPSTGALNAPASAAPTAETLSSFGREVPRHRRRWWVRTLSPLTLACLVILIAAIACGLAAGIVAPADPTANDLRARLQPPAFSEGGSAEHLLGTDQLGRDLLSRVIYGARVSLAIGIFGMLLGALVGTLSGLVAGFARGILDEIIMLLVDAVIALPFLIIALAVIAVFGSSLTILIFVAAFSGWAS